MIPSYHIDRAIDLLRKTETNRDASTLTLADGLTRYTFRNESGKWVLVKVSEREIINGVDIEHLFTV